MFEVQVQELRLPCLCVEDRHAEQRVRGGGGPGGEGEVPGLAQLLPHPPVEMRHPAKHSGAALYLAISQQIPRTLHTAHCTLHTEHCTLHTAHCTLLHTAHNSHVAARCPVPADDQILPAVGLTEFAPGQCCTDYQALEGKVRPAAQDRQCITDLTNHWQT